ncbi:DUF72 domain-containing protein [Orrella sp. JC864]|uniref:DUF72 domain-containing protein n=1 Tax=Orrella sp. JC864 TaxID=3120298 RepID=UPI00300AEF6D
MTPKLYCIFIQTMHAIPILVGTASWTDPTLLACGRFYPPHAAQHAQARLAYYATRFPMVEVDAGYYALFDPMTAYRWAQRTPPGFVFNVKAHRLFTGHGAPPQALPADLRRELPARVPGTLYYRHLPPDVRRELWARFLLALEPLRQAGKLGVLLFQFAPWVRPDAAGRAHIAHCVAMSQGLDCAIELRRHEWLAGAQQAATLAFERELGAAHVVVDSPQGFENTVAPVWQATRDDLAVVRLHGRNAANWNAPASGASSGRFRYEYSEQELAELARRAGQLADRLRAGKLHVVLNTNYRDQGVRNASGFMQALAALPR